MKNKKLIYLAILFIGLLAISSVSASEIDDDDVVLNEEIMDDLNTDLVSSTELQSVDDSEEDTINEDVLNSIPKTEENEDEKNILSEEMQLNEESEVLTDSEDDDEYNEIGIFVGYRGGHPGNLIIDINTYSHNRDLVHIYVNDKYNPRKTINLAQYNQYESIEITPDELGLDFGNQILIFSLVNSSGEHIIKTEEIEYHSLELYVKNGNIFEDAEATVALYGFDKDEGSLTYTVNGKIVGSKNYIADGYEYEGYYWRGENYIIIPNSYLKIGENVISVKYVGPNYPTDEISEYFYVEPRIDDLPMFISTIESTDVVVNFPKTVTGKVNVYEQIYTYDPEWGGDLYTGETLIGSGNIVNGVADIKISNLARGTRYFTVESLTNQGNISSEVRLWVIQNDANVKVEVSPLNILIGENAFITLNSPYSQTLYVTVDGKQERMENMSSYFKVLSNLNVGKHTVSIKYYGKYSNSFVISVNAIKTSISSSNVNAVYDTTKSISATLKDNLGNPIVGKTLSLVINKKTYTAKTNANGKATFKVSAKLLPKAYTATIKFAGDKTYAQFTKSIKVTVKKATPKMTAKAKTFRVKVKTKKYTITLKNNNGKVMKNTKVTLKVNKKTFTAKTNSKGIATFKITNLKKKGSFTAVVTYAATKYYNKVVKKPKITVKK